jgi:predicted TIM-barrel fold metal-dependent hydrolase
MIDRRTALAGGIATMAALQNIGALAKASQPKTAVNFDVPADACDCHTHIHGDTAKFPYFEGRVYTPEAAMPEEMAQLHAALKMKRVVIVTPSIYGPDNAATLWGMAARGADARGVAVIDDKTTDAALEAMGKAGITGIRLNLATGGTSDPSVGRKRLQDAMDRMKPRGWHIQIYTNLAMIAAAKDLVAASPVPVVFDHFGGAQAEKGLDQPGFNDLLELVKGGNTYVKISGAYRAGKEAPAFADAAPLAKALITANPDRIVWGTDWPHPNSAPVPGKTKLDIAPFFDIDDGLLLNQLALWAPDAPTRQKILTGNPARLYKFG